MAPREESVGRLATAASGDIPLCQVRPAATIDQTQTSAQEPVKTKPTRVGSAASTAPSTRGGGRGNALGEPELGKGPAATAAACSKQRG